MAMGHRSGEQQQDLFVPTAQLPKSIGHVADLASSLIMAAEVYDGDRADVATLEDSLHAAQTNQREAGSAVVITDVAADKGYHSAETLGTIAEETPYRTYIPEPKRKRKGHRKGPHLGNRKPPAQRKAVPANRRRRKGARGKRLQRLRSEKVGRTFSHLLETRGSGRR